MDDAQTVDDIASKLNSLVNQIRVLNDNLDESVAVKSISGLFSEKFLPIVTTLEYSGNLGNMKVMGHSRLMKNN